MSFKYHQRRSVLSEREPNRLFPRHSLGYGQTRHQEVNHKHTCFDKCPSFIVLFSTTRDTIKTVYIHLHHFMLCLPSPVFLGSCCTLVSPTLVLGCSGLGAYACSCATTLGGVLMVVVVATMGVFGTS